MPMPQKTPLGWTSSRDSENTLVGMGSGTKGLVVVCVLHAMQEAGADLDSIIADFWPEFAQGGKREMTLGQLLSQRTGLSASNDITLQFRDKEGIVRLLHVRYANVKLGSLDDSPNARLRPPPSVGRVNFALPTEAKYQHESETDVLGLSVTDVPVHTYDMSGNVFEWCCYAQNFAGVIRGGCWNNFTTCAIVFKRISSTGTFGFRLSRNSGK